ncbi:MAG: tryptophan synthase subunit alpha [Desulfobacterales bacterium]|nr:tryptophan synthase subunit alpha [Desulfobacterales bacterium]MDX2510886.1 tryptophan synthase subunit alpha [Desulfobacterales bacterium]
MNRIKNTFSDLQQRDEKALVGFVTAGDPSPDLSLKIVLGMCRSGLDILELGIPFSDPTADGPVIQRSSERSLENGTSLTSVLEMTRKIRMKTDIPIILFSYYNPIFTYGHARFCNDAVEAGADGVLVVDLPPEESDEMTVEWNGQEISLIRLVAPTTPQDRMALIARAGEGFLYLVSKTGVTGSEGLDLEDIAEKVKSVRAITALPICVGFGISTPDEVAGVANVADGVVVGSAFEKKIETHMDDPDLPEILSEFVKTLKAATQKGIGF